MYQAMTVMPVFILVLVFTLRIEGTRPVQTKHKQQYLKAEGNLSHEFV
jgi:hypothetical protein